MSETPQRGGSFPVHLKDSRAGVYQGAAAALILFAINAYLTAPLFGIEYLDMMGSNEGVYIGLARYIREHFPHFAWFPLWYGGIPFQNSYPPLLHFLVAACAAVVHMPDARAYHLVTASLYALGPVALYWTARQFGTGRIVAFLGGLIYSVVSPSCWLASAIRIDSGGWLGPRRLISFVIYGDAPHIAALVLLTLAIGGLHRALETRTALRSVGAAALVSAVALTNWIGAFALALAVACYLLAGWDRAQGCPWLPRWLRAAAIGCVAYGLSAPWITPSTVQTIQANSPRLFGWKPTAAEYLWAAAMVAGIVVLGWILRAWSVEPRVRFVCLFLWSTVAITLGVYWLHIEMLPQAPRYHLEMDLAFCLAGAVLADWAGVRLKGARWIAVRRLASLAVVAACVPAALLVRARAVAIEKPIEIASTAEYRISRWLDEHMSGERVFAPGSMGFWMNTFGDTPMLTGGFDNGIRNQLLWAVNYQIYAGEKLENSLAWLKALGCAAVMGDDPASGEIYHPYKNPEKFHTLRELWRSGPEVIYAVPRARPSLAHVVTAADLVYQAPIADRVAALNPLLNALDDPSAPPADFRWRESSAATISADLRSDQLLYVQVAWDQGWTARVDGQPRKSWADGLGQMVVEPRCTGRCTVELAWDGGMEMRIARAASWLAVLACVLWIGQESRRLKLI